MPPDAPHPAAPALAGPPLARLRCRPFRLPLRAPIETAHGPIGAREGVLLALEDAAGERGLGEASPLPGFGDGEAADALRLLEAHAPAVLADGRLPAAARGPGAAALRCALDTALLDLEGRRRGLPAAALLATRPRAPVEVNAVLGGGTAERTLALAREAWAEGFRTLKLKVAAAPPDEDARRVEAIRAALPDARLRLDANGGWDEKTAAAALARLAACRPELAEQPVPAGDLGALARIARSSPCLVAADEAVASAEDGRRALAAGVRALVLKPMRLGGPRPALALAREAARRGAACVVTTTFDAAVGVAAALHLAAALPEAAALDGPAHGLATAGHLAADVAAGLPRPRGGAMALPSGPGLGVRLDEDALEAAATGPWRAWDAAAR